MNSILLVVQVHVRAVIWKFLRVKFQRRFATRISQYFDTWSICFGGQHVAAVIYPAVIRELVAAPLVPLILLVVVLLVLVLLAVVLLVLLVVVLLVLVVLVVLVVE